MCTCGAPTVGHGERPPRDLVVSFKWKRYVLCVLDTCSWFLECDGCGIWRITVCFSSLYSTVGCPVQLFLIECLRHLVNASPLLFGMRIVRAMPTLSVTVVIACEAAAFSACTLNQYVPSVSLSSSRFGNFLYVALQLNPADECLYPSLLR